MASYLWDFGDGDTSTEQNPQHIYTTPGVYDGSLTCDFGSHVSTSYFMVSAYSSGDVYWDFGDGNITTELNTTHTYNIGTYLVTGRAFDGDAILFSQEITVNPLQIPSNNVVSSMKVILTNLRRSPYRKNNDTLEFKVETLINGHISYIAGLVVTLLLSINGEWPSSSVNTTNKVGMCYMTLPTNFTVDNMLGIVGIDYNGVTVYSNTVRLNLI
jgi:hypothetical protein